MKRIIALILVTLTIQLPFKLIQASDLPAAGVRRSPAIADDFRNPGFTVPDGYTVELVAGPPLVSHPIMAGFDDRGRLFVSETAGLNLRNTELDEQLPNYITMLEDTDGDGHFDKSIRFADQMTFPQGALWHQGALYVSSPPGLWRFEDTDDDGVADQRQQLADGFAYTGNAADVHGPFLHPNGRLYWCHGRKGHEVYQADGKTLVSKAKGARIWSCQPDGSDIQVHAGGGMDNPVEVVFTPEGDIIGAVNLFYGRPRGDVLVHWQYGGAYPRYDQQTVVDEFKQTGDLLKEFHNFGHVAVSGLCRYRSGVLASEFTGNIFQTFFNMAKVQRVEVTPNQRGGYQAKVHDFLQADSTDVHFTDVLEDADGSLLAIDTGGWFRIGCPTSQLAKPEIRGAIYRVRKKIAVHSQDPRGRKIDWAKLTTPKLAHLLGDSRFAVRDRAREQIVSTANNRTAQYLAPLLKTDNRHAPVNAVWALSRIDHPLSESLLWEALASESSAVRQAACNALGESKATGATAKLVELLKDPVPAVQREAAVALGRIGDPAAGTFLVDMLTRSLSRELEHAAIYALIQLNDEQVLSWALRQKNQPARIAALLIAADQSDVSPLQAKDVLRHLDTANDKLAATVSRIARRRSEWAPDLVELFTKWLNNRDVSPERLAALKSILPSHLESDTARQLVSRLLNWPDDESGRIYQLGAELIASASAPKLDPDWKPALQENLKLANRAEATVAAMAVLRHKGFDADLQTVGRDPGLSQILRVKALAAVSTRGGRLDNDSLKLLAGLLGHEASVRDRAEAAGLLSKSRLTTPQLLKLAPLVAGLGPIELPTLLPAFSRNRDPAVGRLLIASLANSPGTGSLNLPELKRALTRYPPEIYAHASGFLTEMESRESDQAARLDRLTTDLPAGDFLAGKKVFESQQALCAVCHRIDRQGGLVGPDLSTIGRIRTKRDLLESILFPSASLGRDFEAWSIDTADGESQTGVINSETSDTVHLAIANGQVLSVPRARIRAIRPSALSLMPQGLDQVMTRKQLADLITYLLNLK
jgi:putative membrane-bound dehydrogenase-like protein